MQSKELILKGTVSGWASIFLSLLICGFFAYPCYQNLVMAEMNIPVASLFGALAFIIPILILSGNTTLQKNEAVVYTFMGTYKGTLRGPAFTAMPFWWGVKNKLNLSIQTIETPKITVNDLSGNPIIISCNIYAHINDTYAATFGVSDSNMYLKSKGEVELRLVAMKYDMIELMGAKFLEQMAKDLAQVYCFAGFELEENPIGVTTLTYAPEVAQAMLQKQMAKATIAARKEITEGAIAIVKDTVDQLGLDMKDCKSLVSGLLITLVSHQNTTPVLSVGQ